MKIQINGLATELAKALAAEGMKEQDAVEWFERCDQINAALDTVGCIIGCDWLCTEMDGNVHVSYWSEKIRHTVMLSSDAYTSLRSLQELAEVLIQYNDEARTLERMLNRVRL